MIELENFNAGVFESGFRYRYFVPSLINHPWKWQSTELNDLLEKTAHKLGQLNSYSRFVPNIDLFIQLHVTKEAVVSSRIEGTQTNINEALLPDTEINPEKMDDWREVNNYIRAMNFAVEEMARLPLSGRLLKQTHKILLDSVRGERKLPGEYRTSQNWIGGLSLTDAVFIPPHHDHVPGLMSDLEHFLHNEEIRIPDLFRIAVAHYQFETIHPFLDGNGRIGRLMIILYLINRGLIDKPLLYLSSFFEKNKSLYYDNLTRVRTHDDMLQWIKYFLIGVEQTTAQAVNTLEQVIRLKQDTEVLIQNLFGKRTKSGLTLLKALLQNPIITVENASKITGLSYKSANDLIALMLNAGILKETTGQRRNRIFLFEQYLNAYKDE